MSRTSKVTQLSADDVHVLLFEPNNCPECEAAPTTHYVILDAPANGTEPMLMRGCEPCCNEYADRLRASLPTATSEVSE